MQVTEISFLPVPCRGVCQTAAAIHWQLLQHTSGFLAQKRPFVASKITDHDNTRMREGNKANTKQRAPAAKTKHVFLCDASSADS
jgi:hypothetical protein